ncbi:MAG: glycosyltransferase family 39 protein [Anaerolineales bacterium]
MTLPYWLILFVVAVVLDIFFIRGMQKYRKLKKEATDVDGNLKISKLELIQQAFLGNETIKNSTDYLQMGMDRPKLKTNGDFLVTTQKSLSTFLFAEGFIVLLFGVIIYHDLRSEEHYKVHWAFPVGVLLILLGIAILRDDRAYERVNHWLRRVSTWLYISPLQVFLLITSPLFMALAITAAGAQVKMWSPFASVATWVLGIGLTVLGTWKQSENFPQVENRTILWCTVVTLLAFLVRAIDTATIPILLTGDEASMGVNAVRYVQGDWNNIFITGWFSFPALYYFIQSIGIRMFENPIVALRIPSALAGALTVGSVYLCGKMMFEHRTGLLASLILASLHLHVHFSRLGLNNIWDGLWFTLTIDMVWYGWKYQARWAYLLGGLSLGLCQYFFVTSKALAGVLLVAVFLAFLFQRMQFHRALPDLCAMFLVAVAVFLPLGWHYANDPAALFAPFVRSSILQDIGSSGLSVWKFLLQQLPVSLGAYTFTRFMGASFWYPSETPLLRPIPAAFFLIGLVLLFFRYKDSRLVLLGLWLFFIALGNALSSMAPVAQRYVAAAPVCALVAGYGLHKITEALSFRLPKIQRVIPFLAYIVIGYIVVNDLWFYFIDYTGASISREITSNGMVAHQFGNYLKGQSADTQVVFFGSPRLNFDSPAIIYLAPQVKGINAPKDWNMFDQSQLTSSKLIFVFLPEYRQDIELVQKDYPDGTLTVEKGWNGNILYWVYERSQ